MERTFRDAAGNVAGAGTRAQGLLDEAAAALSRLGAGPEQQETIVQAIEALTARVEALSARVEQLESGRAATAATAGEAKPKAKKAAKAKAKKPAAKS